MNEQDVLQKLNTAVTHATPNQLDGILSRCQERKGTVIPMTNNQPKKHWLRYAVAACLSLVLVGAAAGGFFLHQARTVTSVVSLDVNPSIQLQVNDSEKVLKVQALNAEAREVLADMPLEGTHLNVAVNAIVGSLLLCHSDFRGGYEPAAGREASAGADGPGGLRPCQPAVPGFHPQPNPDL